MSTMSSASPYVLPPTSSSEFDTADISLTVSEERLSWAEQSYTPYPHCFHLLALPDPRKARLPVDGEQFTLLLNMFGGMLVVETDEKISLRSPLLATATEPLSPGEQLELVCADVINHTAAGGRAIVGTCWVVLSDVMVSVRYIAALFHITLDWQAHMVNKMPLDRAIAHCRVSRVPGKPGEEEEEEEEEGTEKAASETTCCSADVSDSCSVPSDGGSPAALPPARRRLRVRQRAVIGEEGELHAPPPNMFRIGSEMEEDEGRGGGGGGARVIGGCPRGARPLLDQIGRLPSEGTEGEPGEDDENHSLCWLLFPEGAEVSTYVIHPRTCALSEVADIFSFIPELALGPMPGTVTRATSASNSFYRWSAIGTDSGHVKLSVTDARANCIVTVRTIKFTGAVSVLSFLGNGRDSQIRLLVSSTLGPAAVWRCEVEDSSVLRYSCEWVLAESETSDSITCAAVMHGNMFIGTYGEQLLLYTLPVCASPHPRSLLQPTGRISLGSPLVQLLALEGRLLVQSINGMHSMEPIDEDADESSVFEHE